MPGSCQGLTKQQAASTQRAWQQTAQPAAGPPSGSSSDSESADDFSFPGLHTHSCRAVRPTAWVSTSLSGSNKGLPTPSSHVSLSSQPIQQQPCLPADSCRHFSQPGNSFANGKSPTATGAGHVNGANCGSNTMAVPHTSRSSHAQLAAIFFPPEKVHAPQSTPSAPPAVSHEDLPMPIDVSAHPPLPYEQPYEQLQDSDAMPNNEAANGEVDHSGENSIIGGASMRPRPRKAALPRKLADKSWRSVVLMADSPSPGGPLASLPSSPHPRGADPSTPSAPTRDRPTTTPAHERQRSRKAAGSTAPADAGAEASSSGPAAQPAAAPPDVPPDDVELHNRAAAARVAAARAAAAAVAEAQAALAKRQADKAAAEDACRRARVAMRTDNLDQAERLLIKASSTEGAVPPEEIKGLQEELQQHRERVKAAAALAQERARAEQREQERRAQERARQAREQQERERQQQQAERQREERRREQLRERQRQQQEREQARLREEQAQQRRQQEAQARQKASEQYAEATRRANKEAVEEACRRADAALRSDNLDQAEKLLRKASSLGDGAQSQEVQRLEGQLQQQRDRAAAAAAMARERERAAQQERERRAAEERAHQAEQQRLRRQQQQQQEEQQRQEQQRQAHAQASAEPTTHPSWQQAPPDSFQLPGTRAGRILLLLKLVMVAALETVPMTLPMLAALVGMRSSARRLQVVMSGGGLPKMLLWTLSLAVLVVIVAVAAVAARWLLAEAWWLLTGALSVAWRMVSFVWKACIWRPKWWIALPLFGLMAYQRRSTYLRSLCTYPLLWWLSGGRWWALAGTPITFALGLTFGQLLSTQLAWILLTHSIWSVDSKWWASAASIVTIIAYAAWLAVTATDEPSRYGSGAGRGRSRRRAQSRPRAHSSLDPGPQSMKDTKGEVARVLAAADLWEVLEVPRGSSEEVLKRAKRSKSLLVHPDKHPQGTAGATQAFGRVTQAFEVLSNPQKCRQYIDELESVEDELPESFSQADGHHRAPSPSGSNDSPDSFTPASFPWPCDVGGSPHFHETIITNRDKQKARYCGQCNVMHPAQGGDVWLESAGLFRLTRVYACWGDEVLDITNMAHCTGMCRDMNGNMLPADSCMPVHRMTARADKRGHTRSYKKKRGRRR